MKPIFAWEEVHYLQNNVVVIVEKTLTCAIMRWWEVMNKKYEQEENNENKDVRINEKWERINEKLFFWVTNSTLSSIK